MNKSGLSWIISVNKDILSDPLYCKELQSLVVRISVVQKICNKGCTKKHQSFLKEESQTIPNTSKKCMEAAHYKKIICLFSEIRRIQNVSLNCQLQILLCPVFTTP